MVFIFVSWIFLEIDFGIVSSKRDLLFYWENIRNYGYKWRVVLDNNRD